MPNESDPSADSLGHADSFGHTMATNTRSFGEALAHMIERAVVWSFHEVAKPAVRTVVVGIVLIIVGAFIIEHSAWTFPLVIIGAVMIIVAWVGSRLEGRFGIEWNDGGARFELRAGFKPRTPGMIGASFSSTPIAPLSEASPSADSGSSSNGATHSYHDVIEGEGHTIEIDVEELKALVAAAERGSNSTSTATTNGTPVTWQETPVQPDAGSDEIIG